uniref:Uncharacterized protein n=2 Tax=Kalmanozyma brasiliensis (strain GHG001) TaxID=1365824 RepID=V5EV76_KALBG
MTSENLSNVSTGSSQLSSSSSTGIVRKRSQTVSTQDQYGPQQFSSRSQAQANASYHHQHEQTQYARQDSAFAPSRADSRSCTQSPVEPPDQLIGIDALQTAFSAKYYELANKCKSWETYAAKLRAHIGVLEAENRVLQEQNAHLESDNAHLQTILRQEEKARTQMQGRMTSLEDCLSQRSAFEANLDAQYRALEMLELEHLSLPSAPSSVEKGKDHVVENSRTPYCSSNLQFDDRTESRQQVMQGYLNGDHSLGSTTVVPRSHLDPNHSHVYSTQGTSIEEGHSKWDSAQAQESTQTAIDTRVNAGGRSSRLGNRADVPAPRAAHRRSGTVGAIGMLGLSTGSAVASSRGLTSHNTTQKDAVQAFARPASAQHFHSTRLERNVTTTAANIVTNVGVTKTALQSKRRSTVSGERGPLSLAQVVKGALMTSGVVAAQSRQTSPKDQPMSTSDYLQECVEKRREAMRSSFSAQQKGVAPAGVQGGHSRPASRAASRLSTQSGQRSRSRTGSVHDAIPVAIEDVFCEKKTFRAHSAEPSPEFLTQQLAATGLDCQGDSSTTSQRLMAASEYLAQDQLMTRSEMSIASSSPGSFMLPTPARESSGGNPGIERQIYLKFRDELDADEFKKFESCIQRYDWMEIQLEGKKGLITRVKRILLLSDPDLRNKPEKLRRRQQLAREFQSMAKNFGQSKRS